MSSLPDPPLYLGLPLKGCHNIEASAGTGKTTTLALLYLSVVLSGVSPENILVVTFTRAAAQDVRERIRKLLEDVRLWCSGAPAELLPDLLEYLGSLEMDPLRIDRRLREALELFDRSPVQTIHSFCQSLLRQMSFLLGTPFDLALVPEDQDLAYESSVRLWRSTVYGQDPFLAEFFASVWSAGPRGWSATFRAVPAQDDLPEEAFRPVEESFGDYCLRRQTFREEARSALGHLPPGALPDEAPRGNGPPRQDLFFDRGKRFQRDGHHRFCRKSVDVPGGPPKVLQSRRGASPAVRSFPSFASPARSDPEEAMGSGPDRPFRRFRRKGREERVLRPTEPVDLPHRPGPGRFLPDQRAGSGRTTANGRGKSGVLPRCLPIASSGSDVRLAARKGKGKSSFRNSGIARFARGRPKSFREVQPSAKSSADRTDRTAPPGTPLPLPVPAEKVPGESPEAVGPEGKESRKSRPLLLPRHN